MSFKTYSLQLMYTALVKQNKLKAYAEINFQFSLHFIVKVTWVLNLQPCSFKMDVTNFILKQNV